MRISGSRRRSNGRIASIAASDFTSDSALGGRQVIEGVNDANMNPALGWISWTASPSNSGRFAPGFMPLDDLVKLSSRAADVEHAAQAPATGIL